jgi:hypothetical protein
VLAMSLQDTPNPYKLILADSAWEEITRMSSEFILYVSS